MAKSGVMLEGDPATVAVKAKAAELKRELKKLLRVIVEEDDNDSSSLDVNVMDRAKEALVALRELKVRRTASFRVDRGGSDGDGGGGGTPSSCPEEFRCPLSNQLMKDPVIVATGQTYDRAFIQKWLKSGNRTCPKTQVVLSHTLLIPNYLIKEMISQWCQSRGIKQSPQQQQQQQPQHFLDDDDVTENDRDRFYQLLNKMSSTTISEQKAAAKELRLLTKRIPAFRALFGESSDAIPKLITPLNHHTKRSGDIHHHDIQEDLVTTLLNLSIYDNNKKLVAETPMVIPVLIDALKCGTIETRSNAAAALFTLSALDSNKLLIGESGALGPLIDLLDEGHPLAMKDAASAIFNLCIIHENKARAVHEAAVSVVLKKIKDRVQVDELLAILAMLSTHQRAIEELGELRAVGCLLGIIRESCCARNKENCIAILYAMCVNDRTKLREMREEESAHGTLSQLARDGTSRAKRKANGILERINRAATLTHTA